MDTQRRERVIQRKVSSQIEAKLKEMRHNQGRHTSKAYKEYMHRVFRKHVLAHVKVLPDANHKSPMAALGAA